MEIVLFNLNDLALLLVIAQCILLSSMMSANAKRRLDRHLLAAVLLCFALDAFATLAYWSVALKSLAPVHLMLASIWAEWAYILLGPALYWYAGRLLGHKLQAKDIGFHASLSLCYPLCVLIYLLGAEPEHLEKAAFDYNLMLADPFFLLSRWILGVFPWIYALFTLKIYQRYQKTLEEQFSNLEPVERQWVKFILYGFVVMTSWHLINFMTGQLHLDTGHWIGLAGNYGRFIFINVLVYVALEKSIGGTKNPHSEPVLELEMRRKSGYEAEEASAIDLAPIIQKIESDQIYLLPDLTLDELAQAAGVPARALSSATNALLNKNFFEFINGFRVEHAKRLLIEHPKKSIQRVMEESGFSSKSAFHRFFKKIAGVSPSEYRKQAPDSVLGAETR